MKTIGSSGLMAFYLRSYDQKHNLDLAKKQTQSSKTLFPT